MITTPLGNLLIVVAIGIVAGLAFNRYGRGWWARNIGGSTRSDVTTALVGIAGSFIGFHLGVVLGLLPSSLLYLTAVLGAVVVLWAWRGR